MMLDTSERKAIHGIIAIDVGEPKWIVAYEHVTSLKTTWHPIAACWDEAGATGIKLILNDPAVHVFKRI